MSTRHDDLAKGEGKRLADRHVALYRDGGANLHALSSVCPHRGCDVEWNGEEKVVLLNRVWKFFIRFSGGAVGRRSSRGRSWRRGSVRI